MVWFLRHLQMLQLPFRFLMAVRKDLLAPARMCVPIIPECTSFFSQHANPACQPHRENDAGGGIHKAENYLANT